MKADILNLEGKKTKTIDLPKQFEEPLRLDLIKKAFCIIQSNKRQPYGASPRAGLRASAKLSRRRHNYKTAYGYGISRVPRKILTKRGTRFSWVGAVAPGTVSGRKAHPPKAEKIWHKRINKKENEKAIRSALSATINKDLVKARGHLFKEVPLVLDSKLESLNKTKEVLGVFKKLDLTSELERVKIKKIRAGKGKTRGRKYKLKKGPLIVVSETCPLENSVKNLPGINVCKVSQLNVDLLAPGTKPGRLTVYTDKSLEKLSRENLFM